MHIVIGKEDGYIRIIGQEFTTYVNTLYSFYRLIKALGVVSASFDTSISNDLLLVAQLQLQLNRD